MALKANARFRFPLTATTVLLAVGTWGCMAEVNTAMTDTDPNGWTLGQSYLVEYDNRDTISLQDIFVLVRHDARYAGAAQDKVPIALEVTSPQRNVYTDTLYCDTHARSGDYRSSLALTRIPYLAGARLTDSGAYRFSFAPLVDNRPKGVWAIGIEIKPDTYGKGQTPPL